MVPNQGAVASSLVIVLVALCEGACAHHRAVPISEASDARRVVFTLEVEGDETADFARKPKMEVVTLRGEHLGGCALVRGASTCEFEAPYASDYLIRIEDATRVDRGTAARVEAPSSTSRVHVKSQHRSDANLVWWSGVGIWVSTREPIGGAVLLPGEEGPHPSLHNQSRSVMLALGDPWFSRRDGDAWVRMDYLTSRCGTGGDLLGDARILPGSTGNFGSSGLMGYSFPDDETPAGPYLVEGLVAAERIPGTFVYGGQSDERVPVPSVYEIGIASLEVESLEGFMW